LEKKKGIRSMTSAVPSKNMKKRREKIKHKKAAEK
jgi:hypothetical protein